MQIYDYSAKAQFVTRAQQTRNLRPGSKTLFTPAKERLQNLEPAKAPPETWKQQILFVSSEGAT